MSYLDGIVEMAGIAQSSSMMGGARVPEGVKLSRNKFAASFYGVWGPDKYIGAVYASNNRWAWSHKSGRSSINHPTYGSGYKTRYAAINDLVKQEKMYKERGF